MRAWGHHVQERDACHPQCDACSPQAAYLQRAGLRTAVLEKRHVLGGAAVTEEIVPGTPRAPHPPATTYPVHASPPHVLQALSFPGLPTYSACCARRSMQSWSCRYCCPPGTLAGQACCIAIPAVSILTPCLAAAWPEGAAAGPLLLHPAAGGQEPTPLPADGA